MSATINYTFSTGPFDLKSPGPGSVEAYDVASGRGPGACLADAVTNEIYRGHIPSFWAVAVPKIEALTGISRVVDPVATAKAQSRAKEGAAVSDVLEGWKKYIDRVFATLSDEDKKAVSDLALEVAAGLTIGPSPTRRETGPGKAFVEKANSLLASPTTVEEKVSKLLGLVPEFELERDEAGVPDATSLARLIKAYTDARNAQDGI